MLFNRIGFLAGLDCFYDIPGDTGGGGGADSGSGGGSYGGGDPNPPAEPTVYEVDDDTLIKPKGSDKPVKYGEHFRGFQRQFTQASQKAARLERELQARDERLRQIEQAQQQSRQPQSQQPNLADQLRQLPYLDGAAAADLTDNILGQFKQRDQILVAALRELQQMKATLGTLNETHSSQTFDAKIDRVLTEGGYPNDPRVKKLAQALYLAYEPGPELDSEFPEIWRQYWEDTQAVITAQQAAKVAANRKQPFLPGRGGQAGPSRPIQLDPKLSSQEVADQLWHMFSEGEQT
jgi:hypothetical protein